MADDRNRLCVAAERADVLLNPVERASLILYAIIARFRVAEAHKTFK